MKEKSSGIPINQEELYYYLKDIRRIKVMTPEREKELAVKVTKFKNIVKIGRTHLQDATPLTLGQQFSGYHMQIKNCIKRIEIALKEMYFF